MIVISQQRSAGRHRRRRHHPRPARRQHRQLRARARRRRAPSASSSSTRPAPIPESRAGGTPEAEGDPRGANRQGLARLRLDAVEFTGGGSRRIDAAVAHVHELDRVVVDPLDAVAAGRRRRPRAASTRPSASLDSTAVRTVAPSADVAGHAGQPERKRRRLAAAHGAATAGPAAGVSARRAPGRRRPPKIGTDCAFGCWYAVPAREPRGEPLGLVLDRDTVAGRAVARAALPCARAGSAARRGRRRQPASHRSGARRDGQPRPSSSGSSPVVAP